MIEYVFPHNIDDRILKKAVNILAGGGLVAYPTDSSWSIGCSIGSKPGIEKLRRLKKTSTYTPTLLCSEISQCAEFAAIENSAFKVLKKNLPGPFVFILPTLGASEKKWGMKRPEVGIRIPDHTVPIALVHCLGNPLFSLTASRQMAEPGWWTSDWAEENLYEQGYELEDIKEIDLIIDTGESVPKQLTTVIDFTSAAPVVVREGILPLK